MRTRIHRLAAIAALAPLAATLTPTALLGQSATENWPHWRGPQRNGVSTSRNLPVTWSAEDNIVWKTELPSWSGGTPIIWGDRIFLTSPSSVDQAELEAERQRQEQQAQERQRGRGGRRRRGGYGGERHPGGQGLLLLCLSRDTGEVIWQKQLDEGNETHRKQNNTSPSPVTDGEMLWAVTGTGVITAMDLDGNEKWKVSLQENYWPFGHNWGYASSPLLHDGRLYVQVLHGMRTDDPSYVVCLDAATGEEVWAVERWTDALMESPDSYTTPALLELGDQVQIVITGGDYVTGHDADTGAEVWRAPGLNPSKNRNYRIVSSPVAMKGMVYAPTRQRPLLALDVSDGEYSDGDVAWQWNDRSGPDVPTPVCDGKYFYMVSDQGAITCLDARSGEVVYGPERTISGTVSSSPLLADGKLYWTTEDAISVVVKAGPEFELLAENELDGTYTLSSPVPSGDKLFIRTSTHLYCIGR